MMIVVIPKHEKVLATKELSDLSDDRQNPPCRYIKQGPGLVPEGNISKVISV